MPNWTTNALIVHKKDLHHILNGDGQVDFNLMRPMPKSLLIGGVNFDTNRFAIDVYEGRTRRFPEDGPCLAHRLTYEVDGERAVDISDPTLEDWAEFGRILTENKRLYGFTDWYGWSNANWGTKWNACETEVFEATEERTNGKYRGGDWRLVVFLTAWDAPLGSMMGELAAKCSHPIRVEHVDEDDPERVYGMDGEEIPAEDSLFVRSYRDEDDNELTREEYEELRARGEECWAYLV